jgi:hypothetical protein
MSGMGLYGRRSWRLLVKKMSFSPLERRLRLNIEYMAESRTKMERRKGWPLDELAGSAQMPTLEPQPRPANLKISLSSIEHDPGSKAASLGLKII